jgi:hypothetical protein
MKTSTVESEPGTVTHFRVTAREMLFDQPEDERTRLAGLALLDEVLATSPLAGSAERQEHQRGPSLPLGPLAERPGDKRIRPGIGYLL